MPHNRIQPQVNRRVFEQCECPNGSNRRLASAQTDPTAGWGGLLAEVLTGFLKRRIELPGFLLGKFH